MKLSRHQQKIVDLLKRGAKIIHDTDKGLVTMIDAPPGEDLLLRLDTVKVLFKLDVLTFDVMNEDKYLLTLNPKYEN